MFAVYIAATTAAFLTSTAAVAQSTTATGSCSTYITLPQPPAEIQSTNCQMFTDIDWRGDYVTVASTRATYESPFGFPYNPSVDVHARSYMRREFGDIGIAVSVGAALYNAAGEAASYGQVRTYDKATVYSSSLPKDSPVLLEVTHTLDLSLYIQYWDEGRINATASAWTSLPNDTGFEINFGATDQGWDVYTFKSYPTAKVGNPFDIQAVMIVDAMVKGNGGSSANTVYYDEALAHGSIKTRVRSLDSSAFVFSSSGFDYASPVPEPTTLLLTAFGGLFLALRTIKFRNFAAPTIARMI